MKKVRELKKMYDAKSKEISQHIARAEAARKRIEALKAQLNKKSIKEDLDHEQRALKKSVEALETLTVEILDIARKAEKL